MKVTIETGENEYIKLNRDGDRVFLFVKSHTGTSAGTPLDLSAVAGLHSALGMFGAQISPGEPEGDPESPWQIGTRFRFARGVYRGIDLTIIDMRDEGEETEYMIRSDSGHVLHMVRRKDLQAGAIPIG